VSKSGIEKELSTLKEDTENAQHVLAKAALHLRSTIKHLTIGHFYHQL